MTITKVKIKTIVLIATVLFQFSETANESRAADENFVLSTGPGTSGETSYECAAALSSHNQIWVGDLQGKVHILSLDGVEKPPGISLHKSGNARSAPCFAKLKSGKSVAILATSLGWIYIIDSESAEILSQQEVVENKSFEGFVTSVERRKNGFFAISTVGKLYSFDENMVFQKEVSREINSRLDSTQPSSAASAFSDGTIIYSINDQNPERDPNKQVGENNFRTRLIRPNGSVVQFKAPAMATHKPEFFTDGDDERALIFDTLGYLRLIDSTGRILVGKRTSSVQYGSAIRINPDRIAIACNDMVTKKKLLLNIKSSGQIEPIYEIPALPKSDFSKIINPTTGKANIIAGFDDFRIRAIDPDSGAITAEWQNSDKYSGLTNTAPIPINGGIIAQCGNRIVQIRAQMKPSPTSN